MSNAISKGVGASPASGIATSADGIRCMWMRGGTSKGGYFLAEDLPTDVQARDAVLLRAMGSPDIRQIDGMGGADPLTSKVAVVGGSDREGVDVDYLFLQVFVDQPVVTDAQNCGNILAGVGAYAIERGLVAPSGDETSVAPRSHLDRTSTARRPVEPSRRRWPTQPHDSPQLTKSPARPAEQPTPAAGPLTAVISGTGSSASFFIIGL